MTERAAAAEKQSRKAAAEQRSSAGSKKTFLFIGNSLTYYNNFPEMFRSMVKAGTGQEIETTECVDRGVSLYRHAKAIAAVVRTKGRASKLTESERELFHLKDSFRFSRKMFEGYVEKVWDTKQKKAKTYDTVIVQLYYKDGSGDVTAKQIAKSLKLIIHAFKSPKTVYVVNAATGSMENGRKAFFQTQDRIDSAARRGIRQAREENAGEYKRIRYAPCGRAFCNYLKKYGDVYAQIKEPEAYDVYYEDEEQYGVVNDLICADNLHPTQLGSYLTAAGLYSVLYQQPQKTVSKYRAEVHSYIILLNGTRSGHGNYAIKYRKGKGFRSKDLLMAAAKIAWETMKK